MYTILQICKEKILIFFVFCLDVNECNIANNCSKDAACNNLIGSFQCVCKTGYTGNGFTCTGDIYIPLISY